MKTKGTLKAVLDANRAAQDHFRVSIRAQCGPGCPCEHYDRALREFVRAHLGRELPKTTPEWLRLEVRIEERRLWHEEEWTPEREAMWEHRDWGERDAYDDADEPQGPDRRALGGHGIRTGVRRALRVGLGDDPRRRAPGR